MAERVWTDEQLSAIQTRDKTLLVSAAAGSGKTATLTERIIRSLTDAERPEDITSILVVTFTNAAASELRAKIADALRSAVVKAPENKSLERQLMLLPTATIGTIHSFCNDIVRANADKVGLPPNYRVADDAELELLERSIVDGLTDAMYNGEVPEVATAEEAEEISDCLTPSRRTEELTEILRYVYGKCNGSAEGVDVMLRFIEAYDPKGFVSVEKTQHGSYLMGLVRDICNSGISLASAVARELSPTDKTEMKFIDVLRDDSDKLCSLLGVTDYSGMKAALEGLSFKNSPRKGNDPSSAILAAIEVRSGVREDIKKIEPYFRYTEEQWERMLSELHRLLSVLYRILKKFDGVYSAEKRRRGIISYGDMERYAYDTLWQNGSPTDTAKSLAARYTSVYIDEYQDVNALQNKIFEAISRPDNRFMVGDIKQSIYGFRRACPDIFAGMKAAFPPLAKATGDNATIFMSKNFRCNRSVVDFVNGVFDRVFSMVGESIGYESGDRLSYAKVHQSGEPIYRRPRLCLVDKGGVALAGADEPAEAPEVVARKIRLLIDNDRLDSGRPVEPRDVAILLRNAKGHDALYAAALAKEGIPSVVSSEDELFFHTPEVLLTLCLLNAIDNPRRDVYLAGLMCSPLFGFTADDLYLIQHGGEGESLYDALADYVSKHPDYSVGTQFLSSLSHYRAIAEGVAVDRLIYRLYHETGLLSLASHSGGKNNLMLLYDYARGFASGSFKGLYNFISFINNLSDRRSSFDEGREGESENAVNIVTCHHSKGLEYPIVFLADATARLGKTDNSRIVYSEDMGMAMKLRTSSGLGIVESPIRELINKYEAERDFEEELRVLYVALTRARERLYAVGDSPTVKTEEYVNKLTATRDILDAHTVRRLSSYFEILYTCGVGLPDVSVDNFLAPDTAETVQISENSRSGEETVQISENSRGGEETVQTLENSRSGEEDSLVISSSGIDTAGLADLLVSRFSYEYPNAAMTEVPEKMSVSQMTPTVLDGTDDVFEAVDDGDRPITPKFLEGREADESAKRGIATHYFMQFCDLDSFDERGTVAELERLVSAGYISKRDGERVRKREIDMFRRSRLFSDMRSARRMWRELRFNTLLPAAEFTADDSRRAAISGQEILVQGVIDCIIEDQSGDLRVIDYKTDRLTREELADPALAEQTMRAKHENQLHYYALAVERIFGKAPSRVEVYSLHLGDTLSVKREL